MAAYVSFLQSAYVQWKLTVIGCCLTLLFLTPRCFDMRFSWRDGLRVKGHPVNLTSLTMNQLRNTLIVRGVQIQQGVFEKEELIELVQSSGELTVSELEYSGNQSNNLLAKSILSEYNHDELMTMLRNSRPSISLIYVIFEGENRGMLNETKWSQLIDQLSLAGIQTTTFDCYESPKFCEKQKWDENRMVLYMSTSSHVSKAVGFLTYSGAILPTKVFNWLCQTLFTFSLVEPIKSQEVLEKKWKTFEKPMDIRHRIVFTSKLKTPPLFYSALSIIFEGSVQFGFVYNESTTATSYDYFTPEINHVYGTGYNEHLTYSSMKSFLERVAILPSRNDILILGQVLLNMSCLLDFFFIDSLLLLGLHLAKWNVGLIFIMYYTPSYLPDILVFAWRLLNSTFVVSIMRSDWEWYMSLDDVSFVVFVVCYVASFLLVTKFYQTTDEIRVWLKEHCYDNDDEQL